VEHLIEAGTEVGVAERVQCRVDVAESRDRCHDVIADTRAAEGRTMT
jgi:hypothetical protein